jgi:acyl-CoA synthetase (NDP forming)
LAEGDPVNGGNVQNLRDLTSQLDSLFHPKSVAIVGLPRGAKMGKLFLVALLDQGFKGNIYPVHPDAEEIDGLKAYPNVLAIPDKVDLAIILVPHSSALSVVEQCAAKGVKGAVLFTAGYKETGTQEGQALEDQLVRVARSSGMRLLGPNCMGLYCPKTGLSFFPELSREPGPVGIISHSGSLANILGRIGQQMGIRFSKVASLGNECDINSADLFTYLGNDPETGVIGAYLEGIKNGRYFFEALQSASRRKPVILWKVGLTAEGSKAALSHTGALTGTASTWGAVVRQVGGVPVVGFEQFVDSLMGFSLLSSCCGDRIAILSGPGGLAVSAAEACATAGLRLAQLSQKTLARLSELVAPTGTSLSNPVDVGLTASLVMEIYIQTARSIAADPGVDAVVVIGRGLTAESNQQYTDGMIKAQKDYQKPFLVVNIPGFDSVFSRAFCNAGVPFFQTVERAMSVYAKVRQYQLWQRELSVTCPPKTGPSSS